MLYRIPQLTASKFTFSRGYVHLVARRVTAPSQASVLYVNPCSEYYESLALASPRRSYATRAVSRPKAHTGRTKAATPRKATAISTKTPAKNAATKKPKAKPNTKVKTKKRVVKAESKPKPKPKPKPKKKVLSPKSQAKLERSKQAKALRDLKVKSLEAPKRLPITAWSVINTEKLEKGKGALPDQVKAIAAEYRTLSPERREHYNHIATQNRIANEAAYKRFLESHTPEEIRLANNARQTLARKRLALGRRTKKPKGVKLKDERLTRRVRGSYNIFYTERFKSGDFKGLKLGEAAKLVSNEWKALTDSEKQPYIAKAQEDKDRYIREYRATNA